MDIQKTFQWVRSQKGTLYEIPILIFFLLIIGAVLIGQVQKNGWAKGLLGTLLFVGMVLGAIAAIVLFFWVLGWISEKIGSKKPKDPPSVEGDPQ